MSISAPFIRRPVGHIAAAAACAGGHLAFTFLPVAPLPQVDFPTISVWPASRARARDDGIGGGHAAGAQFGRIAGVTR